MRMYINDKSEHPAQKRMEEQHSPLKLVGMGAFLAVTSFILFPFSAYMTAINLRALIDLSRSAEIVNISFPILAVIFGPPMFLLFPLISYSVIIHRRIFVPEELTSPFKSLHALLNKMTKISLFIVTPICFIWAFAFIQWHDYHWCPQEDLTIWNSQWAIDSLLCE